MTLLLLWIALTVMSCIECRETLTYPKKVNQLKTMQSLPGGVPQLPLHVLQKIKIPDGQGDKLSPETPEEQELDAMRAQKMLLNQENNLCPASRPIGLACPLIPGSKKIKCISVTQICDKVKDCDGGEDENPTFCMFYVLRRESFTTLRHQISRLRQSVDEHRLRRKVKRHSFPIYYDSTSTALDYRI